MDKQNNSYRWIVLISVLLTYILMSSQRTAPGLITDQIMWDFNVSAVTIGLLTSIQYLVYTSLQIPMGLLADRFGPNFFLIFGALLTGVGTIIYSVSTTSFFLFFARTLTGIGDATIWVNMVLILGYWFTAKEFAKLIGIAALTGSLGFLLATVPFSLLIDYVGWRIAFFSIGLLLCLCGLLLFWFLIKQPKHPFFSKQKAKGEATGPLLRRIFSNRQAWALFLCHFGIVGTFVGFISSWGVPYGMELYGMTRSVASGLMMTGLIGALIGAPLAGWISSRLGSIRSPYFVVYLTLILTWSVFLLFKGIPPQTLITSLFFMIGLLYGANALTFAAVRRSFPLKDVGIVSGMANTGGFLSAIFLPSIFGKVLDYFHGISGSMADGYFYGFITPVIFALIGLVGVMILKEHKEAQETQ